MNLFKASSQWSSRPNDEKFHSIHDLHHAVLGYKQSAVEKEVKFASLTAMAKSPLTGGSEVVVMGPQGGEARLTNWSFGQLSARVGAPASYLRTLPAPLAAQALNHGIQKRGAADEEQAKLLFHRNGSLLCRAFTSPKYTRIWNADVTQRLLKLEERGPWTPAPAAFDGTRGLYASDHDMFAFLVDNGRRIFEKLPGGGLSRGFFVWNSEVGASAFGIMTFLYEYVCGNHIVWGAKGVKELRIRHVGNADERVFSQLQGQLREFADASASEDEAIISRALSFKLGDNKDEVLDKVFAMNIPNLSQKVIEAGYTRAVEGADKYGDPRMVWGVVNGLTEVARDLPYADERVALDRAAGKVMEVVF